MGAFPHAFWLRRHASLDSHMESAAASRRPRLYDQIGFSAVDVKLALRMLMKQPGLTLVAIFALAIGIPVGLLPLHVLDSLTRPLPVEDGQEIVMVRNYDRVEADPVMRPLHDFVHWRELSSFENLGLWRTDVYNVNSPDGRAATVRGAEVTASVFSLLRTAPVLGRPLTEADQVIGAPDVVVIGYDLWQSRLAGDPDIVGSTIRIGAVPHTVVGVMPEGFLFPYRDHLWLPLRYDPLAYERGSGPTALVMGRLADGISIEDARSEIEVLGQRMASQFPDTHAQLQPQVLSFTGALTDMDSPDARMGVLVLQILAFLLLALACGNVGILILARVATRSGEIAIRTALGASRVRILTQLFIESLVLALLAAGVGLVILQAVATGPDYLQAGLPFWVDFEVSLRTAVLAMSLAVVSAAIAGVVPALKATGRHVQASIQRAAGDGSGIRFGKGYSILIVGEVAVAVWFLALGSSLLPSAVRKSGGVGVQADQYLFAAVRIPRADQTTSVEASRRPEFDRRVAVAHEELARRLPAEPGLGPVAIASALPGMSHDNRWIEVEGVPPAPRSPAPAHKVNVARVDVGYFDALDQPILSGRNFSRGDLGEDRSAVIVNTSFVDRVLGGRNALGRRVRYWDADREPGPWSFEIVGVVASLGMNTMNSDADQGMYHVVAPGELHPVTFAVRAGSDPERFTPRLRAITTAIDAAALIQNPTPLHEVSNPERRVITLGTYLVAFVAGIALVLSAACLYALMSFTVAERRRECAIRTALGAHPANVVSAIAKRAFLQLSVGALIGAALGAAMLWAFDDHVATTPLLHTSNWAPTVGLIALFVMVVGMLACVKPTLRAIRIRPAEVLKG
jgi:predicted permease